MKNDRMADSIYNITEYGAIGDCKTDCTAAIQSALNAAGAVRGAVLVPPGKYLCGQLHVPAGVSISGYPAWSFRSNGASILILNDPKAKCLLDVTGAFGCSIEGVCLDGGGLGEGIHGIALEWPVYNGGSEEDTPSIDNCRIGRFTGCGVYLRHIWCFSIRHSMLHHNGSHGLYIDGWDGFLIDNWFSGNAGAGVYSDQCVASVTATGNRVEWNALAGFYLHNANSINITGNYFDRSGGPAINMNNDGGKCNDVTITGNVLYRSGKPRKEPFQNEYESAHILLNRCINTVISGNALHVGQDDGGGGTVSPEYGIVYRQLKSCVIKDNVLECGAVTRNLVDLGDHAEGVIVKDNPGREAPDRTHFHAFL